MGLHSRLFARIMGRNREVYLLKVVTLAVAFASSVLIILFSLNEFGYDRFHINAETIFRVLQKNTDERYSGNRLSAKIPQDVYVELRQPHHADSLVVARVKIMNNVTVLSGDKSTHHQKIHAADAEIKRVFSFTIIHGDAETFDAQGTSVMLSSRAAQAYFGTSDASGRIIKFYTFKDTIEAKVAAVFKDFPLNSHEDFDVLLSFRTATLSALNFDPAESGIYGRALQSNPERYKVPAQGKLVYTLQPLPTIYFGPRVLGEEARHGDDYSVIILICISSLILFLSLTTFINLTTISLPHRSKELAIKKLAGTDRRTLLFGFLKESAALVGISLCLGIVILFANGPYIKSILNLEVVTLMLNAGIKLFAIIVGLFLILTVSPVFMTLRFVKATPTRLLSTDTITFPKLKRVIAFLQLGISIFLIISSVVVRRQINYSLVKVPGSNHDQIVYLNCPSGITNEGIQVMRSNWKKFNPNILDVMAVSQLPDRLSSKEIGSDLYVLQVDRGFREFFNLRMEEGYWFGPNTGDSMVVVNKPGKERIDVKHASVIGVVEDINKLFNQPEKPVKIKIAADYNYNWLCVRVLEVDIRRTVQRLSDQFSSNGETAHVHYLNNHFKSWIDYQDRLNTLSAILAIVSGVLSCFAIYGLSVSLVRDKIKQIAVHKLFGAHTSHITYLLVKEFAKQMIAALAIFGPITYIFLNELLRTFVYSTKFSWVDPVYPIAYCAFVIVAICGFQALSLNRTDFSAALKA